ncbi:MAG: MmgE/PrpD family protein, partial [Actinomycetota bacterium]
PQYLAKLTALAEGVVVRAELDRFVALVDRLGDLGPDELAGLTVRARRLAPAAPGERGIF